jgi:hypothetical protein
MVRKRSWGRRRPPTERSRGQALVEFALVAPMLFVLILGIVEAGRFIFFQEMLGNATREGARYAIVHGADSLCPSGPPAPGSSPCDPTGQRVKTRVRDAALSLAGLGDLFLYDPVWTWRESPTMPSPGDASTGTNDRGEFVTVFVDFTYRPLIRDVVDVPFLPDITIRAESTLVVNY